MIDHAQLHPYGLCAGRDGGVHGLARRLRTAEDVHHVDSHAQLRQLAPDIFAVNMLSGDLRVDGDDAIAMVLQRLHDFVARSTLPGRSEQRRVGKGWVSTVRLRWSPGI